MCGSKDLIKQDGVFVCQSCGCKYSVEEARRMMIEGTVDVTGSTVKVDTSEMLKNLYTLARRAKDDDNIKDAAEYYQKIRLEDPNSWEAQFYVVYYKAMCCTIAGISSAASSVSSCFASVFGLIDKTIETDEEKEQIITEIFNRSVVIANALYNGAASCYKETDYEIRADYSSEHIERGFLSSGILQCFAASLKDKFGDKYDEIRSNAIVCAIDIYADTLEDVFARVQESDMDLFKDDLDLIKKYHPDFKLPTSANATEYKPGGNTANYSNNEGGCYIATAVYGSYDCPEVWTLRRFRDFTLAESWYGRAFIKTYYATSPTLVRWFGKTSWFKNSMQKPLDNLIKKLQNKGVENTPYNDRNW
jgi:hypothetical protein